MEVLHALAGMVAGAELPAEEEIRLHRHLAKLTPKVGPQSMSVNCVNCFNSSWQNWRKRLIHISIKPSWQN